GTYRHLPPNETLASTFTLALPALVLTAPATRAPVLKGPGATLIVPPEPGAALPSSDTSCALLETETAGPWPRTLFAAAEVAVAAAGAPIVLLRCSFEAKTTLVPCPITKFVGT